eukprot:jgi/Bigna1/61063/fgenesh1_kg.17_\
MLPCTLAHTFSPTSPLQCVTGISGLRLFLVQSEKHILVLLLLLLLLLLWVLRVQGADLFSLGIGTLRVT